MKTIGIITILKADNCGAELQAFATQRVLQLLGYDAEIIDYLYFKHADFHYTKAARPAWGQSAKVRVMEYVKYQIANKILAKIIPAIVPAQRKFYKKFSDFHNENTKLSRTYSTIEDLYKNPPLYDVYVVGSDQVWNPATGATLAPYFLTFAPKEARKISYASSFGVSEISADMQPQYVEWLNNLDSISVREDAGVSLVKSLTGRNAILVLDPTLLLDKDEWNQVKADKDLGKGYVLIYACRYHSKKILEMAKEYAAIHNVPIYSIKLKAFMNGVDTGVLNIEDCGPSGFVHLIANAGLVLTTSFHGTAFAVNMGVPFFTVTKANGHGISRMSSLLKLLRLDNRIIDEDSQLSEIDWTPYNVQQVQERLSMLREKSINYLKTAIDA